MESMDSFPQKPPAPSTQAHVCARTHTHRYISQYYKLHTLLKKRELAVKLEIIYIIEGNLS